MEDIIMRFFITLIFLLTFIVSADDHEQPKFRSEERRVGKECER